MSKRKRFAIGLLSASILASVTTPLLAQQSSSDDIAKGGSGGARPADGAILEDIVVTARRREENIQNVPVAITALSGAKLQQLGVSRVDDLRTVTAGLNIQAGAGRVDNPIYLIRGQRATDTAATQDGPVAVYLDDFVIGTPQGSNLGLFDLESVQVLKGPQGTLFGRNTTGGAILYSTAKPKDQFEAGITGGLGNYDQRLVEGFINIPVSEKFKVRAAMQYSHHSGFSRVVEGPLAGTELQDRDELSGRITAEFDPAEGVKTITTLYGSRSDTNGGGFILVGYNPVSVATFIPGIEAALARQQARSLRESGIQLSDPGQTTHLWGVYNTTTVEISDDITFKNLIGYRRIHYTSRDDLDGTSISILEPNTFLYSRDISEEAQILGNAADGKVNYVFGLYYFNQRTPYTGLTYALSDINPANPVANVSLVRNTSFSGYGQVTWRTPVSGLSATAGLRYTVDRRANELQLLTAPSAPIGVVCQLAQQGVTFTPQNCTRSVSESFDSPTWTLSLDYQADAKTLVYLAHRRGYRSGGFNAAINTDDSAVPFRPETVYDIELGLKRTSMIGSWRVRTNIAAYHQWYKDIQRNINIFSNGFYNTAIRNAASARIYGTEAEISVEPSRNLRFDLNYSFTHARYGNYQTVNDLGGVPNQVVDLSNRLFSFVPTHQVNANVHYEHPLKDGSSIGFTATYFYQSAEKFSEQYQNIGELRTLYAPAVAAALPTNLPAFGERGYGLVGLRLDWSNIGNKNITASIIAKNVTNKRYYASGLTLYDSLGITAVIPGDPRTVMGQVAIRF